MNLLHIPQFQVLWKERKRMDIDGCTLGQVFRVPKLRIIRIFLLSFEN